MLDVRDYELQKTPGGMPPSPARSPIVLRIVVALIPLLAIAAAVYVVVGWRKGAAPQSASQPVASAPKPQPTDPLGRDAAAIDLPPLDQTDAVVRDLVKALSSHPSVAAWLATDGLIRNFTVSVANVAEGRTPSRHLSRLRPGAPFRVLERGEDALIDPRSYERYTTLATAAASLDPAGSARLYATLKPRIEDAYRELGVPDTPFDRTLERAIVMLLSTPVPDEPLRVEPRGIGYGFAAPRLEGLTPAQKHLLRAGPRNARAIQASLREIALALGIPAERLPPRS
jgi:hypothetical protein